MAVMILDYESGKMDDMIEAMAQEGKAIAESEIEQAEHEDSRKGQTPEHKKLQRQLRQEALTRLEEAARTEDDFANVIEWWDRLDANRERKERYHEICRNGVDFPLEYGAVVGGLIYPSHIGAALNQQARRGEYLEVISCCPFEMQDLVSTDSLYQVISALKDERKELLFLCGIQQLSSASIAEIRGQTDRNIRKVRNTLFRQIYKKLTPILEERKKRGLPLTREEKLFLGKIEKAALDKYKSGK